MEEEEEVDIVGGEDAFMSKNERAISYLSSGQILSCDYTVHPQWLADNADATIHWTGNFPKQSSQDEMEMVQDEVVIEEPAPIDFDWCEESSNCGDLILDQDIPASLEEEVVTNSGTEAEDDVSFDSSAAPHLHIVSPTTSSFSIQLPRIRTASVSSNNPRSLLKKNLTSLTVPRPPSKFRQTLLVNRSLLKANVVKSEKSIDAAVAPSIRKGSLTPPKARTPHLPPPKPFQRPAEPPPPSFDHLPAKSPKSVSTSKVPTTIRSVQDLSPIISTKRSVKDAPKFRQSINVPKSDLFQNKRMRQISKQLQMRNQGYRKERSSIGKPSPVDPEPFDHTRSTTGGKGKGGKGKRGKKFVSLHGENITINHDVESGSTLDPRKPMVPPLLADSHKTVQRASSISDEDDVEVDIESDGSSSPPQTSSRTPTTNLNASLKQSSKQVKPTSNPYNASKSTYSEMKVSKPPPSWTSTEPVTPPHTNPFPISDELRMALQSTGVPDAEIDIDPNHISPLEKYFHYEFFEGRPTKTPERFLKIRNFIIHAWHDSKPIYVSKTAVRHGLKQCGDVNCISRIHSLLEQIGAINFGCEQLTYIRPLSELSELFAQPNRSKIGTVGIGGLVLERRSRIKVSGGGGGGGGSSVADVDANYTVSHEDGTILLPRGSRLEDSSSDDEEEDTGRRKRPIKAEFQLIECLRFNHRGRPAPFRVSITLSTLMCLQLHSLSARNEVMGFLGGHRERRTTSMVPTLRLTRYKPCATSSQSSTMCEMCPVSQVEQSTSLTDNGYDLLGWFHSHPAFPPNPSRTDVATQADMQMQFSCDHDRPFVGFILGCVDMQFKCVYVLPEDVHTVDANTVPYELDVDIVQDCSNFTYEIADVFDVIKTNCDDYAGVLRKFTAHARVFLARHGYGKDVLADLNNIL